MSHEHPHDHEHEPSQGAPSEEELRAQLEEQLRQITVQDVLLQTIVSLINLSGQRLGLSPDTQDMRDPEQVRLGIESVRALLPILEKEAPEQMKPVRDALTQLQLAYAREMGAPPESVAPEGESPSRQEERAQRPGGAGGLWVPPGTQT
jgi:hypothetical protein